MIKREKIKLKRWMSGPPLTKENIPRQEVLVLNKYEEFMRGYILGFDCEAHQGFMGNVTHWRPTPFTPSQHRSVWGTL